MSFTASQRFASPQHPARSGPAAAASGGGMLDLTSHATAGLADEQRPATGGGFTPLYRHTYAPVSASPPAAASFSPARGPSAASTLERLTSLLPRSPPSSAYAHPIASQIAAVQSTYAVLRRQHETAAIPSYTPVASPQAPPVPTPVAYARGSAPMIPAYAYDSDDDPVHVPGKRRGLRPSDSDSSDLDSAPGTPREWTRSPLAAAQPTARSAKSPTRVQLATSPHSPVLTPARVRSSIPAAGGYRHEEKETLPSRSPFTFSTPTGAAAAARSQEPHPFSASERFSPDATQSSPSLHPIPARAMMHATPITPTTQPQPHQPHQQKSPMKLDLYPLQQPSAFSPSAFLPDALASPDPLDDPLVALMAQHGASKATLARFRSILPGAGQHAATEASASFPPTSPTASAKSPPPALSAYTSPKSSYELASPGPAGVGLWTSPGSSPAASPKNGTTAAAAAASSPSPSSPFNASSAFVASPPGASPMMLPPRSIRSPPKASRTVAISPPTDGLTSPMRSPSSALSSPMDSPASEMTSPIHVRSSAAAATTTTAAAAAVDLPHEQPRAERNASELASAAKNSAILEETLADAATTTTTTAKPNSPANPRDTDVAATAAVTPAPSSPASGLLAHGRSPSRAARASLESLDNFAGLSPMLAPSPAPAAATSPGPTNGSPLTAAASGAPPMNGWAEARPRSGSDARRATMLSESPTSNYREHRRNTSGLNNNNGNGGGGSSTNNGASSSPSIEAMRPSLDRRVSLSGLPMLAGPGGSALAPRLAQSILTQLDQLLMSAIPSEAFDQLEALKAAMATVQGLILAQSEQQETGTDVEVLSAILKTQHSFDEKQVDAYRAAAAAFDHARYAFRDWSCPQYFSVAPLPSHVRGVTLSVSLPAAHFPLLGGANKAHMSFPIEASLHDTVDAVCRRAYAAYNELLPSNVTPAVQPALEPTPGSLASRLIAKVIGFNDYLMPERMVFEYECVRTAVRNSTPIELLLVERPPSIYPGCTESRMPAAVWQEIRQWQAAYQAKVNRAAQPITRHDYNDTGRSFQARLASTAAIQKGLGAMQHIPLAELTTPFRCRILGAERVSAKTLPRLGNGSVFPSASSGSDSVDLFCRVYLVHGMAKLNHGPCSQTPLVRWDSTAPRFANMTGPAWTNQQWIMPPPANLHAQQLPYSRLPRGTRVLFLLYACPASSSNSGSSDSSAPLTSPSAATLSAQAFASAAAAKELEAHEAQAHNVGPLSPRGIAAREATTVALKKAVDNAVQQQGKQSIGPATVEVASSATEMRARAANEVLLGWSACQLIDESGVMVSGQKEMNLWTFGCGVHEKDYNYGALTQGKEDLNQIMRGTNKHNPMPIPTAAALAQAEKDAAKNGPPSSHAPPPAQVAGVTPFATLTVEFERFALPVVAPLVRRSVPAAHGTTQKALALNVHPKALGQLDRKQFAIIMASDPLYTLTSSDRELIWLTRSHLVYHPSMLPKFLSCVDWTNAPIVAEAHKLLRVWSPPLQAVSALELLDAKYPDFTVREYAVHILDTRMADAELQMYLLQLTQCLKFEAYHDSPLSRFLLRRSLANPYQIGHHFFWHLKAEVGNLDFQERFTLILEEYLTHAGLHARELRKQNSVVQRLQKIAELIVKLKVEDRLPDSEVTKEYQDRLNKLNRDFFAKLDGGGPTGKGGKFQIPLNPKLEARRLIVGKCKFMSSKKVPLWLVFENADELGPPIYIIFKSGDDLRQDILTLQLLKIMDAIWLDSGLDMRLSPYKCIATGVNEANEGVGMIEVVMGSDTTSGIQLKYGGGAIGALKLDPLDLFIRNHNAQGPAYDRAVDNFIRSCAGYCVATFVLGIGDRHNGNIMVTTGGRLFHIDFGHFLGNFKTKFGFNRERSAFVFTPEMAYVMGGKKYKSSPQFKLFKECCFRGFNTLRKHAATLENLFLLMCSAGMPELMERENVLYLRDMLCLDYTEKQAAARFKTEIKHSLDGTWRRIDNWIHNAVHG